MAHRCEHLADGESGFVYVTLGIAAELCPACLLEFQRRLETETRPETPIEAYAREREEAMAQCAWVRKNKHGNVVESCHLLAQDGGELCPRHGFLYNIAMQEEQQRDELRRLKVSEMGVSKHARTRLQLCQAGYVFQGSDVCSCGKRIEWWLTPNRRNAPYNPMPEPNSAALSHFATCSEKSRFRKAS